MKLSLSVELQKIKKPEQLEMLTLLGIMILGSALAYFLDHARIAAFGIMPVIALRLLTDKMGISLKETPLLFFLKWGVSVLIILLNVLFVVFFPK